jgi:LuxR family transcriptional regulator, maltose regulon positive regulatory protein
MLSRVTSAVALSSVAVGGAHPVEIRLSAPPRPNGLAARPRQVNRLLEARDVPLALIVAPAGYGKTTVLSEWAERDGRPFAWLSLDEEDDDPVGLLAAIAAALETSEPVAKGVRTALSSRHAGAARKTLPRLLRYITYREQPVVLVLDDVDRLQAPEAFDVLQAIAEGMPPGSQLVLSSRSEPALAVGSLRAHRRVVELRAGDLAMTLPEAAALLRGAGLLLPPELIETLVRRTEGWPVGLYLAALSLREQRDVRGAAARFGGDDRLVAEYLRDEFLRPLGAERAAFLTGTAVLETLSGPLCDAVLESSESGSTLAELAHQNALLVSIGRNGDSYRQHRLLQDMLRGELHRLQPQRERRLHRRASAWYASQGEDGPAIRHAVAAGDVQVAASLLWASAPSHIAHGRNDTVQDRLNEFTEEQIAASAPLALVAASSRLAAGDGAEAERCAAAAVRGVSDATGGEARSLLTGIAVVRGLAAREGLAKMGREVRRAREVDPGRAPLHTACNLLEGVALHLTGDRAGARDRLEEGGRGDVASAPHTQALCLAQLALLMIDAGDRDSAATTTSRARSQLDIASLRSYPSLALVFAVSSAVRAQRGLTSEAAGDTREARALLARVSGFAPWYEAETRIVLAQAALRLSDLAGARELVSEAARFMRDVPDSPVLRTWLGECTAQLRAAAGSAEEAWTLTAAELRVLHLLPTHLSFPAIAKSLYVSPNTVKTHARAVYRKLDASSRAEAVALACEAGLLDVQP